MRSTTVQIDPVSSNPVSSDATPSDPVHIEPVASDDEARWSEAQQLFDQALAEPASERHGFVRDAVCDDTWLRDAVLDLLNLDDGSSPLDQPLDAFAFPPWVETRVGVGDQLDKYRLLERLGIGGMGCVYRAEHVDGSVRQEVAIKVLRADLSAGARYRFAQEQRILANLQHPKITRLQDFGSTSAGVSYLVMNLVEGTSITEYADANKLSIVERIRLFVQVCDAVHYAHRRLVVHRDLKPANILVNADGDAQLLDFGIAKVLDPEVHLEGLVTRTELRMMTPSYASPEQLLGRQVTTGTDVWALGVLLFELLTGRRPFDWSGTSLLEIERHLLFEPGPKASAAFSAPADETIRLAHLRGLEPGRLCRRLQGDLDLIIGRALAYQPEDRYHSVEALAQDLERFLGNTPILARPPSLIYRVRKFVRRHVMAVAGLAATLVCLSGFIVLQATQSQRLMTERDFARQQADKAELMSDLMTDVLDLANPVNRKLNHATQTLLDQGRQRILHDFDQQPVAQADMLTRIGILLRRLGNYDEAEKVLTRAAKTWEQGGYSDALEAAQTFDALGFVYHQKRDPRAAATLLQASRLFWQSHGGDHPDIAQSLMHLAAVMRFSGERRRSEALLRRAIAMDQRLGSETTAEAGARLADLATLVGGRGDRQQALLLYDRALEIQRSSWGPRSVAVGLTMNRKAGLFQERPWAGEGAELLHAATEIFRDRLGEEHPLVATGLNNLAQTYVLLNEYEKAESLQRQAWERDLQRLGEEHPSTLDDRRGLAMILRESGRLVEAEEHLRQAVTVLARVSEPDHPALISQRNDFARVLLELGQKEQAAQQLELAFEAAMHRFGADHWLLGSASIGLAELALQEGDLEEASVRASDAVRIFEGKQVGPERWRLGEAQSVLGATLLQKGHWDNAESCLRAAAEVLGELRGSAVTTRLAEARLQELEAAHADSVGAGLVSAHPSADNTGRKGPPQGRPLRLSGHDDPAGAPALRADHDRLPEILDQSRTNNSRGASRQRFFGIGQGYHCRRDIPAL